MWWYVGADGAPQTTSPSTRWAPRRRTRTSTSGRRVSDPHVLSVCPRVPSVSRCVPPCVPKSPRVPLCPLCPFCVPLCPLPSFHLPPCPLCSHTCPPMSPHVSPCPLSDPPVSPLCPLSVLQCPLVSPPHVSCVPLSSPTSLHVLSLTHCVTSLSPFVPLSPPSLSGVALRELGGAWVAQWGPGGWGAWGWGSGCPRGGQGAVGEVGVPWEGCQSAPGWGFGVP